MSSVEDIFLKWVFPLLGGIVGTLMFMAPMKAVLRARRERELGVRFELKTRDVIYWLNEWLILNLTLCRI